MLTIRGAFLDTGNKREVTVGKAACKIQRSVWMMMWNSMGKSCSFRPSAQSLPSSLSSNSLSSTMLTCKTPPHAVPSKQPVRLTVDSVARHAPVLYTYNQDPLISSIQPSRSFVR